MKTVFIEASLARWFQDGIKLPEKFGDRVAMHLAGTKFSDRTRIWIAPRIAGFDRSSISRNHLEHDVLLLQVTCYVQVLPKGALGVLSLLVDQVREKIDSSEGAPAAKIYDDKNEITAVCDFGPAQESRAYGQAVEVGGIPVPGVDLAVLTVRCQLSRAQPRRNP